MTAFRGGRRWRHCPPERSAGRPSYENGDWRDDGQPVTQQEIGPRIVAAWFDLPPYIQEDFRAASEEARVVGPKGLLYRVNDAEAADAVRRVLLECCGDYPGTEGMNVSTMGASLDGQDFIVQAFVAPIGSPEALDLVAERVVNQTNELLQRSPVPFRLPVLQT